MEKDRQQPVEKNQQQKTPKKDEKKKLGAVEEPEEDDPISWLESDSPLRYDHPVINKLMPKGDQEDVELEKKNDDEEGGELEKKGDDEEDGEVEKKNDEEEDGEVEKKNDVWFANLSLYIGLLEQWGKRVQDKGDHSFGKDEWNAMGMELVPPQPGQTCRKRLNRFKEYLRNKRPVPERNQWPNIMDYYKKKLLPKYPQVQRVMDRFAQRNNTLGQSSGAQTVQQYQPGDQTTEEAEPNLHHNEPETEQEPELDHSSEEEEVKQEPELDNSSEEEEAKQEPELENSEEEEDVAAGPSK